jgi:hypothetical protein
MVQAGAQIWAVPITVHAAPDAQGAVALQAAVQKPPG